MEDFMIIKSNNKRLINFDLLKIVAFIMVVFLHYNNKGMGGGLLYSQGFTLLVFKVIESICIVAVPLFLLITGYFSSKNKSFCLRKIIGLYILFYSYRFVCFWLDFFIFHKEYEINDFFLLLVPSNYYINLYSVLILLSPFINKLFNLSKKIVIKLILILVILFVVLPSITVMYLSYFEKGFITGLSFLTIDGDLSGYSIVMFIIYYLIGAIVREYDISFKKIYSILIYLLMISVLTPLSYIMDIWNYNNIFVLISATSLFLFFKELKISEFRFITVLSSCSLGVFILHTQNLFLFSYFSLFNIGDEIAKGFLYAMFNMFTVVFSIILICVCSDLLLRFIVKPIKNKLYSCYFVNKKIFDLSENNNNNIIDKS